MMVDSFMLKEPVDELIRLAAIGDFFGSSYYERRMV